jgi:hypothetical protein
VSALGVLLAAGLALLLLVQWGDLDTVVFSGTKSLALRAITTPFYGGDLPHGFRVTLISLSILAAMLGVVALVRPLRHPVLLLVACVAMVAAFVLVAFQWNDNDLFTAPNLGVLRLRWKWASLTIFSAFALSGAGALVWLGLFVASVRPKRCPDCAERVRRSAIDCPHCGYRFPLSRGLKRCEACERPIKAEARVCRYCHHRVGEPAEQMASAP